MLRIAFIGAGQMASQHLAAIRRSRVRATVVGVHDRSADRAEAFAVAAGCRTYPGIDALLTQSSPEVVHVCTPPGAHVEAASAALKHGAHVYVEKPFAPTMQDARTLLDLSRERRRLVCAGHQLLYDPAFHRLMARASGLGHLVQVDSHFAFRPVGAVVERSGAPTLAKHLIDILPHPLYSLVSVLERCAPAGEDVSLAWMQAGPTDVQAVLRAGGMTGRLSVSLRSRPVSSFLTLTGTRGSLTCDFVRSMVVGAGNPGTEALEKVLNPIAEGAQLASRATRSTLRRLSSGVGYPGLAELISAFYEAIVTGGPSPVAPDHLLRVTALFEAMVHEIERPAAVPVTAVPIADAAPVTIGAVDTPRIVVTGARGFLGAEIARALTRVRGIGRGGSPGNPHIVDWVSADLSQGLAPGALAGAEVVVHAAAEVAGGYDEHRRNSVEATQQLLQAMHTAGVRRLVHVSSLSVIKPPRHAWERQDESTPRPDDPRALGPYTWGKCAQEALVEREAAALGIKVRIIRPGALLDRRDPDLPGLMGRRLFGKWHLGLGRPGLPIAVIDVEQCADAIAWCVNHFDDAPPVVNLLDPSMASRRDLLARLGTWGWNGHMVWVPISVMATALTAARTGLALAQGTWPGKLSAWSVLRPRRYDMRLSEALIGAATAEPGAIDRNRMPAATQARPPRRFETSTTGLHASDTP